MKVLLVEDDEYKEVRVVEVLKKIVPELQLQVVKSVRMAVTALQSSCFDHIILDIALPSHNTVRGGGAALPMPSGGIEVLLELAYQKRPDLVTILTQYPEIEFDGQLIDLKNARLIIRKKINANVVDVIRFEMDDESWKELLKNTVQQND